MPNAVSIEIRRKMKLLKTQFRISINKFYSYELAFSCVCKCLNLHVF